MKFLGVKVEPGLSKVGLESLLGCSCAWHWSHVRFCVGVRHSQLSVLYTDIMVCTCYSSTFMTNDRLFPSWYFALLIRRTDFLYAVSWKLSLGAYDKYWSLHNAANLITAEKETCLLITFPSRCSSGAKLWGSVPSCVSSGWKPCRYTWVQRRPGAERSGGAEHQ